MPQISALITRYLKKKTIHSFDAILPCNNKATKNFVKDAEARRSKKQWILKSDRSINSHQMTCGISIRSWFFLLHHRFSETNVLECYISFAVCLSLLKQNKRTGAYKPFKSAVTNRFLKSKHGRFNSDHVPKKVYSLLALLLCVFEELSLVLR